MDEEHCVKREDVTSDPLVSSASVKPSRDDCYPCGKLRLVDKGVVTATTGGLDSTIGPSFNNEDGECGPFLKLFNLKPTIDATNVDITNEDSASATDAEVSAAIIKNGDNKASPEVAPIKRGIIQFQCVREMEHDEADVNFL